MLDSKLPTFLENVCIFFHMCSSISHKIQFPGKIQQNFDFLLIPYFFNQYMRIKLKSVVTLMIRGIQTHNSKREH